MPFHSHRHFRERTLPAVDEGLARAGRTRADLAIVPQAIVAMGRTPDALAAASTGVRGLLAFCGSIPAYLPVLEVEGWAGVQPELHRLSTQGEWAAEIRRRFGDVAERVCCYFPGYDAPLDQVRDLAAALA
jgi:alkanesulfonate monooxygenase SsuD/methylene tetrahydromethanopterin reductase-like flavin-dependent oxidoreductase (luciferase family)